MKSPLGALLNRAPVSYVSRNLSFPWTHRNDAEAQMRAMGAVGTLYAIVNRTSTSVAAAYWRLWRKAASGKAEDRVEVVRHAALDVWNKPNPFYTGQEFREATQQHTDLTGEGWWVIARNARVKIPLELWPVRPDRMTPVPHPTDFLSGYIYTGPSGEQVPLGLDEVIQIRMPNPLDPYRGMGPVQSILTDLDSAKYSAEWNRNFFINGAEPGGIIEVPNRLDDDEFAEMTERWREQHQGVANAHRVAVIESGKWVDRKFSQRDMQFTELRVATRDTIMEAFGIHKSSLGIAEDVNRANAEAGEVMFARRLVVPRLERIKGALNNDFLPLFGPTAAGLEFDYDNPVPDDEELENAKRISVATAAKIYIDCGATRESVQEAFDLPATLVWEDKPAPLPVAPVPVVEPAPALQPAALLPARRPRNAADLDPADLPDVTGLQDQWQQALDDLLAEWQQVSAEQKDDLVRQVEALAESGDLAGLTALETDSSAGADLLAAAMVLLAAAAAAHLVTEAAEQGIKLVAKTAKGLAAVAEVVAALLASDLATSAARVAIAVNGPAATSEDVADAVAEHLDSLTDAQPALQLGGALTGAQNAARIETLRAGPEGAVYSSEVNDRSTCSPCKAVNGTWLGNTSDMDMIEKSYPAGAYGGYIHCKGGPRCRGTVVGVWRPETTGDHA